MATTRRFSAYPPKSPKTAASMPFLWGRWQPKYWLETSAKNVPVPYSFKRLAQTILLAGGANARLSLISWRLLPRGLCTTCGGPSAPPLAGSKSAPISRSVSSITFPHARTWRRLTTCTRTCRKCEKRWRNGKHSSRPFASTIRHRSRLDYRELNYALISHSARDSFLQPFAGHFAIIFALFSERMSDFSLLNLSIASAKVFLMAPLSKMGDTDPRTIRGL